MTLIKTGVPAACLGLLAPASVAQDFSYPDFSSVAGLSMNADAGQSGALLRVTPSATGRKGSVYYDQPTRVSAGFTTTFTFQFTAFSGGGADGMAFIIQNASSGLAALGDDGSGMGYAANSTTSIENCIAVEFDTWDSGKGDPDDDHVSVHTGGTGGSSYDEAYSIGRASVPGNMSDGAVHTAVIRYAGGLFEVFVDDLDKPLVSVPYDFATGGTYMNGNPVGGLDLINEDSAFVGFTGATGGSAENHDVLSWDWKDAEGPIGTSYCGPANLNSLKLSGVITGFGTEEVAANSVELTAGQLPPNEPGMFLASTGQGFIPFLSGSNGNLCLAGPIGRYTSSLSSSGEAGEIVFSIDLADTPTSGGRVAIQPGETWYFQGWYRDVDPTPTFNFTDGLSITFE